ncbi:uncharacterized protein [Physcomitrium patens]|uniref:Knr4/Smi1-like domain-containing protein n=1 Tax=Physcomitrium patens TaxID=3218 RepID=A0A2K1JYQ7_PHYPA|nr:uncharacterized protein LOC112287409 [Physcomitrium patens]PNR46645.1 hypothetical protein PHYPA_013765 [Physcomitrium patens]|eukprot:XP_024386120.1 uncharacterized protein LOC112287409 [Physcomitrella patens]
MLDLEHRPVEALKETLTHHQAQLAGLKRLSARASAGPSTPGTRRVFFSFSAYARSVIDHLKKCEVPIAEGLSDEEFEKIEATYGFTFPPDLKGILQEGLPTGSGFPNWRTGNVQQLRMRINLPILRLLHEVAHSRFWWKPWGPRPLEIDHAVRIARSALRKAPLLVPMHGHCYISSAPNDAGNPVFLVYQNNVVYCGYDVADFFEREAFRAHDGEPPFELDEWQGSMTSGRSSISGSGELRRAEQYTADIDSTHRTSSSSCVTDLSDLSGSGSAEGQRETWGRNLDVLAKNAENLGSPRKKGSLFSRFGRSRSQRANCLKASSTVDDLAQETESPRSSVCQEDLLRYGQIIEKSLPPKALINLSMAIPPWAARSPRRIEFWSELVDKYQKQRNDSLKECRTLPPTPNLEVTTPSCPSIVNVDRMERTAVKSSKWLTGYFEEMSLVLRQGGWEENDISDMMDPKASPEFWNQQLDAEAVLVTLAREVELLSTSLKKAGWSVPDVTETMKTGFNAVW